MDKSQRKVLILKTSRGQLKTESLFKLIFVGWVVSWGTVFAVMLPFILLISATTGQMGINGEMVEGLPKILLALLPALIMFPIIIILQGAMVGFVVTFGVWLYQKRRPILVMSEEGHSDEHI